MTSKQVSNFLNKKPGYMKTGAKRLAKKLKTTIKIVKEGKEIRRKSNRTFLY